MSQSRIRINGRSLTIYGVTKLSRDDLRGLDAKALARLRAFAGLAADYGATTWQRQDGWRVIERLDKLSEPRYTPAELGSFAFEVGEPDDEGYVLVQTINDQGTVSARDVLHYAEVGGFIAAAREAEDVRAEAAASGRHPFEVAMLREAEREQGER